MPLNYIRNLSNLESNHRRRHGVALLSVILYSFRSHSCYRAPRLFQPSQGSASRTWKEPLNHVTFLQSAAFGRERNKYRDPYLLRFETSVAIGQRPGVSRGPARGKKERVQGPFLTWPSSLDRSVRDPVLIKCTRTCHYRVPNCYTMSLREAFVT